MDQDEDLSVRSNHNENILPLKEGDLGYPQVQLGYRDNIGIIYFDR